MNKGLLDRSAPWTGAVIAFLGAAAAAAGVVPADVYEWSKFYQAVAIILLGLLGTPFGVVLGVAVLTRLRASQAQLAATDDDAVALTELERQANGEKPLKPHLIEDHQQDLEHINRLEGKDLLRLHARLHRS